MIIINADDFGRSVAETDAAVTLVRRARVTSLSAMVFMEDSQRAAEIAGDLDADIGLHLNFCERWKSRRVPHWLREHHESLVRYFNKSRYALVMYNPSLWQPLDAVYQAEIDEFHRLYGRAPSHIDGHRHLHLSTNVIIDGVIAPGAKVRRSFTFSKGEKGVLNRTYRKIVDSCLQRCYVLTDYFFSLEQCLSGRGRALHNVAELAQDSVVEVMTHPRNSSEFQCLDGQSYVDIFGPVAKGTHAELTGPRERRLDHTLIWTALAGLCECTLL